MTKKPAVSPRTWVGEVELGNGLAPSGVTRPVDTGDTRARLLVRVHGTVLGFVDMPLDGGPPSDAAVWAAVELAHGAELRAHLDADGVAMPPAAAPLPLAADQQCSFALSAPELPVSVVVCTRDRTDGLTRCLDQLLRLSYEHVEFVIVDNAPTTNATRDTFAARVGDDPRFRYVVEPRPGLSKARNRGLAEATAEIVVFTDDDVQVDAGWLRTIVAAFTRDRLAGCVTGLVPPAELDSVAQQFFDRRYTWSARLEPRVFDLLHHGDDSPLYPFSAGIFGTGANFAVDKAMMLELGGFDEALGAGTAAGGGEDLDAFVRVILSGRSIVYEPSAVVWHSHRAENRALRRQLFFYGAGLTAFLTKYLLDPRTAAEIITRVPPGLRRGRSMWSPDQIGGRAPRSLVAAELAGMVAGPLAYLRGRLATRRSFRPPR